MQLKTNTISMCSGIYAKIITTCVPTIRIPSSVSTSLSLCLIIIFRSMLRSFVSFFRLLFAFHLSCRRISTLYPWHNKKSLHRGLRQILNSTNCVLCAYDIECALVTREFAGCRCGRPNLFHWQCQKSKIDGPKSIATYFVVIREMKCETINESETNYTCASWSLVNSSRRGSSNSISIEIICNCKSITSKYSFCCSLVCVRIRFNCHYFVQKHSTHTTYDLWTEVINGNKQYVNEFSID